MARSTDLSENAERQDCRRPARWLVVLGTIILATPLLASSVAADTSAISTDRRFASLGNAIFFSSDRGHDPGDSAIYQVATAGGAISLVYDPDAAGPSYAFKPVPSPDGSKVVFTQQDGLLTSLTEMNADGTAVRVLKGFDNNNGDSLGSYAWSPDGSKIVYSAQASFGAFELHIYNLASGSSLQLTSQPSSSNYSDDFPAWSPDGAKIAYFHRGASGATRTVQLNVIGAGGGSATSLFTHTCTSCGASYTMGPQAWSPDGAKIAYSWSIPPSANDDVYTVNSDGSSGGTPTRVGGGANGEWWPAWSPDGTKLAVTVSDAGDNYLGKLYTMVAATGAAAQLTDGGGNNFLYGDDYPAWGTAALSDAELLRRYVPQIRYDAQESYRADAADEITDNYTGPDYFNMLRTWDHGYLAASDPSQLVDDLSLSYLGATYPGNRTTNANDYIDEASSYAADAGRLHALPAYGNKIYGRAVRYDDTGELILQYWLFYYYNGPRPFGIGDHEGDWEMVQYHLDTSRNPVTATYAQHRGGERCDWNRVQQTSDGHPIVYSAFASHASYFSSGQHVIADGEPAVDRAGGDGYVVIPSLIDSTNAPAWIYWPGKWGGSGSSPRGPRQQGIGAGGKWDDPRGWSAGVGGCTEGEVLPPLYDVRRNGRRHAATFTLPLPRVTAVRYGRSVRVHYHFAPTARIARLEIVTSVDSTSDRRPPLTATARVRARVGQVTRRLPAGKGPFRVLVSVRAPSGETSRTRIITLK